MTQMQTSISEAIMKAAEGFGLAYQKLFQSAQPEFCTLDTADSNNTLVTAEGRLLSGFVIDGLTSAIGSEEFEDIVLKITNALRPFLKNEAHTVQIFASCEKDGIATVLKNMNRGTRATLKRLDLKLDDVLNSSEEHMSKFCSVESQYIAIWTHPNSVSPTVLKTANQKRKLESRNTPAGSTKGGAQGVYGTLPAVREKHESFVKALGNALGKDKAGFSIQLLTSHEMLRISRKTMDPGFTPDNWRACLPGDKIPGVFRGDGTLRDLNFADVQYPPISWQIFPRDGVRKDIKYYEMGDRIFAPVYIEITPQEIEPFSNLFEKLNTVEVPWSVSFTIDGGGMKYVSIKAGVASFMTWANPYNAKINESVTAMREHAIEGATYVRLKIAFMTWAPIGQMDLLRARVSKLVHSITSWGDCEVRENVGNPSAGFFSCIPFLSHQSIANPSVAPINHVMRMLPLMRQASHWNEGSVLYRTRDGKPLPFEPGSDKQDTWNYVLFAPPGSGKSVQIANLLKATILQPGITQLPRIGIIDIGPSSQGLIWLIRDALPADQRHKVAHIRLRNTKEYAINPFDTFLGCRFPTPSHKAFLINLLVQIATPAEREDSYSSISEIASQVIDDIFRKKSDSSRSEPNLYAKGEESDVDLALSKLNFSSKPTTSWWTVVDRLFDAGYIHEATLAQRYASPTMSDIPGESQSQTIRDQFSKPLVETTESLCDVFARLVTTGTRMYPLLAGQTKFDLGEIRIAAIDIEEVAKSGSVADDRQAALMYLVARFILTKDYRLDKEYATSNDVPVQYRDYLSKIARDNKESLKWIVYDEFHRTAKSPSVRNEVLVDMREGRKWNLGVILASQSLEDFPDVFKEFATGVFILKAANRKVAESVQKLFGLNDTTTALMLKYCNGPDPLLGAPMVIHLLLKSGATDMLAYSTLGPQELWAFSTTAEDAALRERVGTSMLTIDPENGPARTRSMLAKMFPGGVKGRVAAIKRSLSADQDSQDAENGAIETLAKQVLARIQEEA